MSASYKIVFVGKLLTTLAEQSAPTRPIAVLSGPSFAKDIAVGLPTALTLACQDEELGAKLCNSIGNRSLRPYWSNDIVGTQVGGALKNVIAIGIGQHRDFDISITTFLTVEGVVQRADLVMGVGEGAITIAEPDGDLTVNMAVNPVNVAITIRIAHGCELIVVCTGKAVVWCTADDGQFVSIH